MTALDWVLLAIVGLSALLGLLRGVVGMAMSLAAWLLAGVVAYLFGGDIGRSLLSDGELGWGEYLGGYAIGFFAVWMIVGLLGLVVRRLVHSAGLSGPDRMFGLALGVLRGVFFASVLVLMLGLTNLPRGRAWQDSTTVVVLLPAAKWMRGLLPPAVARRVDLEGRGASLQEVVQETVQETEMFREVLPHGRPRGLPEQLGQIMPGVLPAGGPRPAQAPQPQQQIDPKAVLPGQHDEKLVH